MTAIKTPQQYFKDEYGSGRIPLVMAEEDHVSMFALIKEYSDYASRLQIEKDRERLRPKFNIEIGHKHGYEVYGDIAQCIHETPIQLD